MVKLKFFTLLREAAGKSDDQIPEEITLEDLVEQIKHRYGSKFNKALFDENGALKTLYQVVVNGRTINLEQSWERILTTSDSVSFLPPVGGGDNLDTE